MPRARLRSLRLLRRATAFSEIRSGTVPSGSFWGSVSGLESSSCESWGVEARSMFIVLINSCRKEEEDSESMNVSENDFTISIASSSSLVHSSLLSLGFFAVHNPIEKVLYSVSALESFSPWFSSSTVLMGFFWSGSETRRGSYNPSCRARFDDNSYIVSHCHQGNYSTHALSAPFYGISSILLKGPLDWHPFSTGLVRLFYGVYRAHLGH